MVSLAICSPCVQLKVVFLHAVFHQKFNFKCDRRNFKVKSGRSALHSQFFPCGYFLCSDQRFRGQVALVTLCVYFVSMCVCMCVCVCVRRQDILTSSRLLQDHFPPRLCFSQLVLNGWNTASTTARSCIHLFKAIFISALFKLWPPHRSCCPLPPSCTPTKNTPRWRVSCLRS